MSVRRRFLNFNFERAQKKVFGCEPEDFLSWIEKINPLFIWRIFYLSQLLLQLRKHVHIAEGSFFHG